MLAMVNGGNPDFLALLNAVQNEDAVEGSITADNFMAAKMICDHASEHGDLVPAEANGDARIVRAEGVALRRYGLDRTTRRQICWLYQHAYRNTIEVGGAIPRPF